MNKMGATNILAIDAVGGAGPRQIKFSPWICRRGFCIAKSGPVGMDCSVTLYDAVI